MTTLYPAPAAVKPARKPFAFGIQVPKGPRRVGYTAADAAEVASWNTSHDEDARIDAMAEEAAQMDRYEAGYAAC